MASCGCFPHTSNGKGSRACSQSKQPNDRASEKYEAEKAGIGFVISCSDATKLFESVEEAFNQIAIFVQVPIDGALLGPIGPRWNDGMRSLALDRSDKRVGIVPVVGKNAICRKACNQGLGLGDVGLLASRQDRPHWIPESVHRRMNLGGQSDRPESGRLPVPRFFLGASCVLVCPHDRAVDPLLFG